MILEITIEILTMITLYVGECYVIPLASGCDMYANYNPSYNHTETIDEAEYSSPKPSNTPLRMRRGAKGSEISNGSAEVIHTNNRTIFLSPEKYR